MRLWGSVAFIATSVGIGAALAGRGEELIIQTIVACLFGVFVATALLPNRPTPPGSRGRRPARTLLRTPPSLLFVPCGGPTMASHALPPSLATIHCRAAGLGRAAVGRRVAGGVDARGAG